MLCVETVVQVRLKVIQFVLNFSLGFTVNKTD